ncbi:hypothetical protein [Kitasatospora sp. NPDC059571]|uniref:hypothetical protein n=1 Tax=Kitasatospora sp. NPDC059571 TaxID=3346871 RepID=UPI0036AAB042
MDLQLDAARATIEARLRVAEQHRLARAAQRTNRTARLTRLARQALTGVGA